MRSFLRSGTEPGRPCRGFRPRGLSLPSAVPRIPGHRRSHAAGVRYTSAVSRRWTSPGDSWSGSCGSGRPFSGSAAWSAIRYRSSGSVPDREPGIRPDQGSRAFKSRSRLKKTSLPEKHLCACPNGMRALFRSAGPSQTHPFPDTEQAGAREPAWKTPREPGKADCRTGSESEEKHPGLVSSVLLPDTLRAK